MSRCPCDHMLFGKRGKEKGAAHCWPWEAFSPVGPVGEHLAIITMLATDFVMPGLALSTVDAPIHSIPTKTLGSRCYFYSHSRDATAEASQKVSNLAKPRPQTVSAGASATTAFHRTPNAMLLTCVLLLCLQTQLKIQVMMNQEVVSNITEKHPRRRRTGIEKRKTTNHINSVRLQLYLEIGALPERAKTGKDDIS